MAGVLCAVLLPATANAAPPDGSDSLGWRGTVTITHDVDQVYPVEGNSSYTTIHDVATISVNGTGAADEHGSQTGTATGARDSRSGTARYDCGLAEGALADTDAGHGAGPGVLAVVFATAPDGSRLVEISGADLAIPAHHRQTCGGSVFIDVDDTASLSIGIGNSGALLPLPVGWDGRDLRDTKTFQDSSYNPTQGPATWTIAWSLTRDPDTDGDGWSDADDACDLLPADPATSTTGCPPGDDSDGDGFIDAVDMCPSDAWTVAQGSADGCKPRTPVYVAMGDSFSSGEGACNPNTHRHCAYLPGTDTRTDRCHRSANAYPSLLSRSLPGGYQFRFIACSGAVASNITSTRHSGEPPQILKLEAATDAAHVVRLVTLSVGGNDIGFQPILTACVIAGLKAYAPSCRQIWSRRVDAKLRTFGARLAVVYRRIHKAAPQAHLVVLGYPQIFDRRAPSLLTLLNCDARPADARWVSTVETRADSIVAEAVNSANRAEGVPFAEFVSNEHTFDHHELCRRKLLALTNAPSAVNGWLFIGGALLQNVLHSCVKPGCTESFHPNELGHELLATRVRSVSGYF